jgi:hypothetical protein
MSPHYVLHCKDCGFPLWLLADTIRPLFAYPEVQSNRFHAIAVGCARCKNVGTYTLHKDFPGHNPEDTVIAAEPHYGDVIRLGSLECEEEGCGTLLPLFALWSPATTSEERRADVATWRWENSRCPRGHSIPKPEF